MFFHDDKTNRLSIQEGRDPPWVREFSGDVKTDRTKTWLYCPECKDRYCVEKGQRNRAHIPYRDKASQYNLRPHRRFDETSYAGDSTGQTQPEPEEEPEEVQDVPMEEEGSEADEPDGNLPLQSDQDSVPDLPAPMAMPTLETYKTRWAEKLAHHAQECLKIFSLRNLVPKPVPQLWQDCRDLTRIKRWFLVPRRALLI